MKKMQGKLTTVHLLKLMQETKGERQIGLRPQHGKQKALQTGIKKKKNQNGYDKFRLKSLWHHFTPHSKI